MNAETLPVIYTDPSEKPSAVALIEGALVLLEKAKKYKGVVIQTDSDAELIGELRARVNDQANLLDAERLELTAGTRALVKKINDMMNETYIKPLQAELETIDASITSFFALKKAAAEAAAAEQARIEKAAQDAAKAAEEERLKGEADLLAATQIAAEATSEADKAAASDLVKDAAQRIHSAQIDVIAAAHTLESVQDLPAVTAPKSITGKAGSHIGMRDNWTATVTDATLVPEAYLLPPIERIDLKLLNTLAKSQKGNAKVSGVTFSNNPIPNSRVAR